MNAPEIITDADRKVKDALDVWAEWQCEDNTESKLGYGHCIGFEGSSSVSGWDDFERKVEKNMAVNVQAILEGLPQSQQDAVFHFHIAAVIIPRRTRIEDDYANALMALQVGLRRRGLI